MHGLRHKKLTSMNGATTGGNTKIGCSAGRLSNRVSFKRRRGGSRFAETQQFLEFTFGPEKSGTLNTYAIMKSGINNVDSTGRSGPIPSQIAQKRLDDYKALAPDEKSQELDGKALYTMGYQRSLKENEELKKANEILSEENNINRELVMRMYAEFGKEPPADLQCLGNLDARHHQATENMHAHGDTDNNDNSYEDDDCSWHERNAGNGDLEGDEDHLEDDGYDPTFPRGNTEHSNDQAGSKDNALAADRSGTRASN